MLEFPKKLSDARILVTNDDSIHSEGIKVLEEIALSLSPHVWVVAPETQQSAAGHSLTIHSPLRIKEYDERHVSVSGTPTDSVLIGIKRVMKGARPHLVLSGINHGKNMADDVTYSGTIAAAIEATLLGLPAIAFSQDLAGVDGRQAHWDTARTYVPRILRSFEGKAWERNVLINVNIPARKAGITPEIRVRPQGHYHMEDQEIVYCTDPRGKPYFWIGEPPWQDEKDESVDSGSVHAGHVTVTPLSLNLTHHPTLKMLEDIFK